MSVSIDYNKLLSNIDRTELNKILKNVSEKGFSINGFNNLEKAPIISISSTLKSKKRQANIFLKEICDIYNTEEVVKKIKNGEMKLEDIKKIITQENKIGLVTALLLGSPDKAEEAMDLLESDNLYKNELLHSEIIDEDNNNYKSESSISEIADSGNYLCKVEHRSDEYYFIKPIFYIKDNKLVKITGTSSFGSTGKIKISAPMRLKSINIEYYKFYIFNINREDIYLPPIDENGEVKAQIYENKIYDSRCETDDKNIYEIIKLDDNIDINEFKARKERVIHNNYVPLSRKIYIESKGFLYGPFGWKNRNEDLEICLLETSYFVSQYKIDDLNNTIYYIPSDNSYEEERKIIYNNRLNMKKAEFDFIDDNALKDMISKSLATSRSEKTVIKNILRDLDSIDFSEERKKRVVNIFKNFELVDDTIDDIISNILDDDSKCSQIVDKIFKNQNYIKKINKINEIDEEIERKKAMLKDIENHIEQVKESQVQEKIKEKSDEVKQLELEIKKKRNEKEKIEKNIQELNDNKGIIINAKEWEEKAKHAEDQFNFYSEGKVKLKDQIQNLSTTINQKIESAPFNGLIASEMLKAANEFEKENNENKDIVIASKDKELPMIEIESKEELIEYVCNYIIKKSSRTNFVKNDIINILLCISQGFLTVFAGPPGTGKTSLCDILAKILGLSRNDKYNRYIEVSVEKGWTSKRDFIGYYNPLTKTFDKADKKLFSAFETLNAEKEKNIEDFPYFILLDEANLSPMEHYWADFMNVCDFDKSKRMINLSEDFNFYIPNTLRFLATINYDHTTEILSPRLIDRAWIILLDSMDENIEEISDYEIDDNLDILPFEYLVDIFGANKKLDKEDDNLKDEISMKFNEIYKLFREAGVSVSPRILKMIKRYCVVGENLFDKSDNIYVSLDYAIAQKILPLINGYGDKYKDFLIQLQEKCDKSSMPKCNEIIKNIIKKGDTNMQYYQFFTR